MSSFLAFNLTYQICFPDFSRFPAKICMYFCILQSNYIQPMTAFLCQGRMASSGMLHRVALVITDVSEELSASFIRVTRIGELGTTVTVSSNRRLLVTANVVPNSPILVTVMKEALSSSEMSILTRATRRNIPEDDILHSHRRENLKPYTFLYQSLAVLSDLYIPSCLSLSSWTVFLSL
jgi:hypothetical protein